MARAVLLAISVLAFAAPAAAQGSTLARARIAFERGRVAYEAGRFEEALEAFQQAHQLTGSPEILYNIGTVADRLRRDELALESYRGYLAAVPSSPDHAQVQARVEVLEGRLVEERERQAREQALRDELQRAPPPPPPEDPGPAPWILAGVGGAFAVAGAVLIVVSVVESACVSDPSGCVETPSMPRWEEVSGAYERAPIFQGVGGALVGVGAAALAAGLVWGIATLPSGSAEVALGPGSVALRGRFP